MRYKGLALTFVIITILISHAFASDYYELIQHDQEITFSFTPPTESEYVSSTELCRLIVPNVENWKDVVAYEMVEVGSNVFSKGTATKETFELQISGTTYATGTYQFVSSQYGNNDRAVLYFDTWDFGSQTGTKTCAIVLSAGTLPSCIAHCPSSNSAQSGPFMGGSNIKAPVCLHQTTFITKYRAEIYLNESDILTNSTYHIVDLLYNRDISGDSYPSTIDVRTTSGDQIYIDSSYAASGSDSCIVDRYPTNINVIFGYPVPIYNWSKVLIGDNPDIDLINYTPTATPTATPTPGTDLCQYWSLSLNTSNINRNEAVLGTLTETDPDDRYDMIDWYRVLPNGAEYITKHYIYDSGLFGLGAGWFLVDSYTGYTEASSVDEALENEIDFTTSGGAHYVRVRIYDDKSLLPLVYHDYDHVCTKEAIVYVGETTQSLTQQGINVYEADTNAFLSDVSLSVYDYGSGEWQNKTSTYGATTYFNAVPGHSMRVLATKAGWLSSDSTFTVANPPVPYAVYLKRPLPDIANKSYAFFNVRDSVTHMGLYQATIQLSDGQLQSTLPSGYAGFSVNDSESYYYTVSKPGYQTLTSTFSISEDTTIPVLLVQIAPTPTVTLPITTLPTVTVTGTLTPTVTGTTTLTATGTYSNATLAAAERVQKTTKAADVWYTNAETLSNLLFLAVIVGVLGLMSNAMDKRRRRR